MEAGEQKLGNRGWDQRLEDGGWGTGAVGRRLVMEAGDRG